MKYYAVTDDPNELMHFGIKGMKWGVIRSPEQLGHYKSTAKRVASKNAKPKSQAYINASSKLRKMMRSGIEKAKANWEAYNSPQNKAVREHNRDERRFQKHVQLARQGRLKYKGISDDEIYRINDRLALENMARARSGQEKQSFARRLRSAAGEGIIQGVGLGTSGYISERMRGRGKTTAEIKGERRKIRSHYTPAGMLADRLDSRHKAREMRKEARRDVDKEFYKQAAENGEPTSKLGTAYKHVMLARERGAKEDDIYKSYGIDVTGRDNKGSINDQIAKLGTRMRARLQADLDANNAEYRTARSRVGFTRRQRSNYISAQKAAKDAKELEENRTKAYDASYFKKLAEVDVRRNHPTLTESRGELTSLSPKAKSMLKEKSASDLFEYRAQPEGISYYSVNRDPKHRKTSRRRARR